MARTELSESVVQSTILALDAVDKLLTSEIEISGLKVVSDLNGFTHIDAEGNLTSALRMIRAEDSGFTYTLLHVAGTSLSGADITRVGTGLNVNYSSEPVENSPALRVVTRLGQLVTGN